METIRNYILEFKIYFFLKVVEFYLKHLLTLSIDRCWNFDVTVTLTHEPSL